MLRRVVVFLHRYVGLATAGFLVVEGLTGSLLAFDAEVRTLLDPKLSATKPAPDAKPLDPATLAKRAAEAMPEAVLCYYKPRIKEDQVVLRMCWNGPPAHEGEPEYLVLDPWTGRELGRLPFEGQYVAELRDNVMPFVFMLHTNLALGSWGGWLLGIVALAWTIDCFVGFYLTLPVAREKFWRRWRPSWLVKWRGGFFRVNFDLHRASGLWLWPMLFVFAWSSVELDSVYDVYGRVTGVLFDSNPLDVVTRLYPQNPDRDPPKLHPRAAQARGQEIAEQIAAKEGFHILRTISMQYVGYAGRYNYSVLTDRPFPQDQRLTVFFDSNSGEFAGLFQTRAPLLGDTISNWLLALHQIRDPVDYLAYRLLVFVTGIVIALLSATGVYIWWKKRKARLLRPHRRLARERAEAARADGID
ncbi:MAG TPA: PepSY-associated TM helix domain-containing protein [Methylocystis sp.]|nr:PepSY-associated TM helix domain-containing protein [Methylocystis sp.]